MHRPGHKIAIDTIAHHYPEYFTHGFLIGPYTRRVHPDLFKFSYKSGAVRILAYWPDTAVNIDPAAIR